MLSEFMCQESINAFISLIILGPCTWSLIIPPIFLHLWRPKKKSLQQKWFQHWLWPFFFSLTAGKMVGVPRKERNRLRRVERREGRLDTVIWQREGWLDSRTACVSSQDKQGPEKQLPTFSASCHPASHVRHRTGREVCVSQWREVCVCPLPGPKTHPASLEGYCI